MAVSNSIARNQQQTGTQGYGRNYGAPAPQGRQQQYDQRPTPQQAQPTMQQAQPAVHPSDKPTIYKVGDEEIRLSPNIVRKYLVSGDAEVSDQEVAMFIGLCRYQRLNPFIKEAYLIKYSAKYPATIVTGKDAFMKRAYNNPKYRGQEAGVLIINGQGQLEQRTGSMVIPGEQLVGGWARVYVDGYTVPIEATVSFNEYNQDNQQWRKQPATMIRKVALVQALRDAFPVDLGGMYTSDEMGTDDLDETTIAPRDKTRQEPPTRPQEPEIVEAEVIPQDRPAKPQAPTRAEEDAGIEDVF